MTQLSWMSGSFWTKRELRESYSADLVVLTAPHAE